MIPPARLAQHALQQLAATGQIIQVTTFEDHMRPDVRWIEPEEYYRAFLEMVGEDSDVALSPT